MFVYLCLLSNQRVKALGCLPTLAGDHTSYTNVTVLLLNKLQGF